MPVRVQSVLAEAWALFARDRGWLLRVAAPFLFLPVFALELLVPAFPAAGASDANNREAQALAWAERVTAWVGENGAWYLLALLFGAYGSAAICAAYLDGRAVDVRGALGRAGSILPRYFLAALLVAVPAGAGLYLLVVPGLFVLGRTMMVGPVLVAERPVSAGQAALRSIARTGGSTLAVTALAGVTFAGGYLLAAPFMLLDAQAGLGRGGQVLAAAGVAAASLGVNLAQALIAVVVYRRLRAK